MCAQSLGDGVGSDREMGLGGVGRRGAPPVAGSSRGLGCASEPQGGVGGGGGQLAGGQALGRGWGVPKDGEWGAEGVCVKGKLWP